MKQIFNTIKIISIFFIALGFLNCEEEQVYFPKAFAEFTYTINQETGVVKFINTSRNATIFTWTFGDGQTSTETNPSHIYQPGTYTVSLVSKNIAGSFRTYQDVIVVGEKDDTGGGGGGTCTAETTESIAAADLNITFLSNTPTVIEDNVAFSWIDNPDSEGSVNMSCKVGQVVRANNSPYDNIQIDLADKLDFNASEGIKMKVWSSIANTPVLLKLEEIGNSGNFVEISQSTGAANTWTELTYDFAATATPQFNKMVIFFNFNVGDGSTYYFDDIALYSAGGGGGGTCVAETAESIAASSLNITFQTDTPAVIEDNAAFSWIDNPDFEGTVNSSCKVGQVVRVNNSPYDNIQIDLADKLDFNTSEGIKMKVWSPIANTPVLLKLEEIGNSGNFVEISQSTGAANTWTELTYNFEATATPQFNKMVIFFNFNVADASTYYFDDVMVYGTSGGGGTGGGTCPDPPAGELLSNGDFEAGESCWQFFAGTSISTTVNNGGSNSAEMQGATGVAVNFKQERFAIGVVQPNTSYTVSFDIIADGPFGDGGVFKAFAFSEGADGGTVPATLHTLTDSTTSLATTWETKTYTFTTAANANQVEGGISFLLEIVNSSAKLNVDNVVIKKTP